MDAVIDPVEVNVVGFVPPNAQLTGPWADFITLPAPEDMDQETLGVTKDGDEYVFCVDPTKVQAKTDAQWTQVRAQQRQKLYERTEGPVQRHGLRGPQQVRVGPVPCSVA